MALNHAFRWSCVKRKTMLRLHDFTFMAMASTYFQLLHTHTHTHKLHAFNKCDDGIVSENKYNISTTLWIF